MGFAFWRSKKRAGNAASKAATRPPQSPDDDVDSRGDLAADLRARARHRLIGASALLLAVAVVVPMLLDPAPRPVSENIPIDVPSERAPFAPRLSLPAVPAADGAPVAPPPDQPVPADTNADAKAAVKSEARAAEAKPDARPAPKAPEGKVEAKPDRADDVKTAKAEEPRARSALESKADEVPAPVKGGKFAVQAAAPASEKAARDLAERLKKGGFAAFIEKVETRDGARYRVRTGPYATREDAERVRSRLKSMGISGNTVSL